MNLISHDAFELSQGSAPLLVSVPHAGTAIPAELRSDMQDNALAVSDTDWFLDQIYAFATDLGASFIKPKYSRYVIDLNRPPTADAQPMYAGTNNTELCPTRDFTGKPIYRHAPPDAAEIARRSALYWQPYHQALRAELDRLKALHGYALLWDGHSIQGVLPWLFEGRLPDLNIGTNSGASCDARLQAALERTLQAPEQAGYSHAVNGRFKGGYITRHYGQPAQHIHAVQLEMCWSTYMQPPGPSVNGTRFAIDPQRAAHLEPTLKALLQTMLAWQP